MIEESGRVQISICRGGTISEFTEFLNDFEGAYNALRNLPKLDDMRGLHSNPLYAYSGGLNWLVANAPGPERSAIIPEYRLEITRVRITSPGFMEFMASWSPLEQLREYLKDRHQRRMDVEWREAGEKRKLELENELLSAQVETARFGVLRDYKQVLNELEIPPERQRELLWRRVGVPLSRVGRHQDIGLIAGRFEGEQTDVPPSLYR